MYGITYQLTVYSSVNRIDKYLVKVGYTRFVHGDYRRRASPTNM